MRWRFLRGERLWFPLADHRYLLGLGAAIFSTNFLLFYYAAQHVASGLLSIAFSLASVGNVVLGALVFGAKIERRVVIGGALGVGGVAAMFYPELGGLRLDGAGLVGSGAGARRHAVVLHRQHDVGGGAAAQAADLRLDRLEHDLRRQLRDRCWRLARGDSFTIEWSVTYLGGLLYLAIAGSFIAFSVYFTLLGRIGAARTGYTTVMYPVVALLVSTFAENYQWTIIAVLGLAAVLIGNVLILRVPK